MKTKKEVLTWLKTVQLSPEKFEEEWSNIQEDMQKRGYAGVQLEEMTARRATVYFKHLKMINSVEIEFIPLGISNISDFGAQNAYDEARKQWDIDPDRAFEEKYCDRSGVPLWRNVKNVNKIGKPIRPEQEKRRTLYGLAKRKEDNTYKPAFVNIGHAHLNTGLPIFGKLYTVNMGLNGKGSEAYNYNKLLFSFTQDTSFKEPKKTPEPVHQMIQKHLKEFIIDVASIREKSKVPTTDFNTLHVFKSDIISSNVGGGYSSRVNFEVPDENEPMTGWVATDYPINIKDESLEVWFVAHARTYHGKKDGTMQEIFQLNIYGMHASNELDVKTEENTPKIESANAQPDVVEEHIGDVGTW